MAEYTLALPPSEVKAPKPNKSACGFWTRDPQREWEDGRCKVFSGECLFYPHGEKFCGIGQNNRALYARQQAEPPTPASPARRRSRRQPPAGA